MSLRLLLYVIATIESMGWTTSLPETLQLRKYDLGGIPLSFAFFNLPPFNVMTTALDGRTSHTGSNVEIFGWLKEKLNFSLSYLFLNETTLLKYGSTSNMVISLITNQAVDGSAIGMIVTPDRKEKLDFAYVLWTEQYKMIVPSPEEEPRLFAFMRPFKPIVWGLILLAMVVMVLLLSLFSKVLFTKRIRALDYIGSLALYITNTITNQGGSEPRISHLSFRILIGLWLLAATVLVNSYSGNIISYLTVPKLKERIKTFADLAARRDVGLIVMKDIVLTQHILEAKSGAMKILGDQLRSSPQMILASITNITDLLETGNYAFPYLETFCKFFIVNQFKKENKCRFQTSDSLPMSGFWALALQKKSKFTPVFNIALMELWETGLINYWVKKAVPSVPQCFVEIKHSAVTHLKPIELGDLTGVFMILGVGMSLSFFVFFIETLCGLCHRKPKF